MIVKSIGKFLRISPLKTRQVVNLIRGKDVLEAQAILSFVEKKPRFIVRKILDSAVANAKVKGFSPEQLYISKIVCDQAAMWKRYRAASFGRATMIRKKTSHVKIELDLKAINA